jgi:hypothetical protein
MEIKTAIKQRIAEIENEKVQLTKLLESYGGEQTDISKSDRCRHVIQDLIKHEKAYHITEIEKHVGLKDVKGIIHQVLNTLRESGEVIAVRLNGSNQKYYYMSSKAKSGEGIKDEYLPIPKHYVSQIEVM